MQVSKYLTEDAESSSKGFVYAEKGSVVEVINESDPVSIVQDESGNRFPVRTELLSDTCPELKEKIEEQETVIAKQATEKKVKVQAVAGNQSKLF